MNLFGFFKKKQEKSAEEIYHEGQFHAHELHDYETAFKLYTQAADMGLREAKYDLAVLYFYGKGGPFNRHKAFDMVKALADELMPEAEEFLAMMYFRGEGVEKDLKMAYRYFQKGVVLNNTEALLHAGLCLAYDKPVDKEKVDKIVNYWTRAAELGVLEAKVNLGLLYYDGELVPQNYDEAFKWFLEAAEEGHPGGIFQTARCYDKGAGVEQNMEKAMEYYRKGMEMGEMTCANNLGSIYLEKGDLKEAYNCYCVAAKQGFKPAQKMCDEILKYVNSYNKKMVSDKTISVIKP